MTPLSIHLFLKKFNGTIIFSVQFLFHLDVISRRGVLFWNILRNIMPAYGVHDFSEIVCKMCKDVLWVCWISKQFQSAKNINQQIQPTVAPLNNQIIEYHYITIIVKCVKCVSSQRYLFPMKSGKTVTTQNKNSRFLFFLCSASCSFLAIPSSLGLAYSLLELKLINMRLNESFSCTPPFFEWWVFVIKGTFFYNF